MSKIKDKAIKCPVCGAPLELKDEGYGSTTCPYCRAIVYASRDDASPSGETVIYDQASKKPIASISIPIGWDVVNSFINYDKAIMRIPYGVGFDLDNNMGSIIHVETGNSYEKFGAAGYLGQTQQMHTIQKPFETVDKYLDEYVQELSAITKKEVKYKEDLDVPIKGYDRQKDFENCQKIAQQDAQREGSTIGQMPNVSALYCDSVCRVYESGDKVIVAYTKVYGWMLSLGGFGNIGNIGESMGNLMHGIGNMFNKAKESVANKASNTNTTNNTNGNNEGILNKMANSGLLGGMLGKKFRTNGNSQPAPTPAPEPEPVKEEIKDEPKKEEVQEEPTNTVYYGQIRDPHIGESYMWMSDPVFILITTKDQYKNIVKKAFTQVCSSFKLAPEVISEHNSMRMQWEQENRNMMNNQAAAQRQNGQNLINIGAQRMAANQSYIDSMMARSNRQYQSQRDSYNSRMDAQDRMRDARSEAIRGVNTYIKPDGHEVEVPVTADTAWINGKGEIVGGSAGFDPGSGWTKMERK